MFTLLTAWISQRIITVTAVSVLAVAAVPTTLVITSRHDDNSTVAVIQPVDDRTKALLISEVKTAGDDLIARLTTAEASCSAQLAQTVSTSTVATKIQPALAHAKVQLHSSVSPIVATIRSDEDRFQHLRYVSRQDEENELADLDLIAIMALGNSQTPGMVTITCQAVTVTVTQTIQITVIEQVTPGPCTSKDERDDD
jgi:hypothetical protein